MKERVDGMRQPANPPEVRVVREDLTGSIVKKWSLFALQPWRSLVANWFKAIHVTPDFPSTPPPPVCSNPPARCPDRCPPQAQDVPDQKENGGGKVRGQ